MSLGPQCRACRQRRVRCDSAYPACAKCSRKGIECPGYSSSRALRWRHYVSNDTPQPEESMPKLPRALELDGLCMRADDVAPWGVISYNLDYCMYVYNHFRLYPYNSLISYRQHQNRTRSCSMRHGRVQNQPGCVVDLWIGRKTPPTLCGIIAQGGPADRRRPVGLGCDADSQKACEPRNGLFPSSPGVRRSYPAESGRPT